MTPEGDRSVTMRIRGEIAPGTVAFAAGAGTFIALVLLRMALLPRFGLEAAQTTTLVTLIPSVVVGVVAGRRHGLATVVVGADGVRVQGRFVAFRDMQELKPITGTLPASRDNPSPVEIPVGLVLGAGTFRAAAVRDDDLVAVLRDPSATPDERVGAALALRARDRRAAEQVVRGAVEAIADLELRDALLATSAEELDERRLESVTSRDGAERFSVDDARSRSGP